MVDITGSSFSSLSAWCWALNSPVAFGDGGFLVASPKCRLCPCFTHVVGELAKWTHPFAIFSQTILNCPIRPTVRPTLEWIAPRRTSDLSRRTQGDCFVALLLGTTSTTWADAVLGTLVFSRIEQSREGVPSGEAVRQRLRGARREAVALGDYAFIGCSPVPIGASDAR